jgi:hypothetical protein
MISRIGAICACAVVALAWSAPSASQAAVVIYSAYDSAATGPDNKPNADAARAAFMAAVSNMDELVSNTFETGPTGRVDGYDLGGGASLSSTDQTYHPLSIRTSPGCGFNICGGNTTVGGHNYAYMTAGEVVFSFDTPIQAFGAFFNGVQFDGLKLVFNDGSAQSVAVPGKQGVSFVGFTDFGQEISEIRFKAPLDYVSIDDVVFGRTAVPEPASWALMISGFGLSGFALRTRRRLLAA